MQPRDLSAHEVYEPGRGIEEVAREQGRDPEAFVKLASNENPHGPSPKAVAAIREAATEASVYPTAVHTDLTERIAVLWEVEAAQVWLANGGDGALDYLARAALEPGDGVLVPDPGFSYYPMSARYHHGEVREYPVEEPFELSPDAVLDAYDGERIVYLTTPHNPTGATYSLDEVETIADETDEATLVVVDEAYGEFTAAPSAVSLVGGRAGYLDSLPGTDADPDVPEAPGGPVRAVDDGVEGADRDDVAVLRSFSKAYGLAGVRLGYAVVPREWADAYARVNTPFAASTLACRAGLAALQDGAHVRRSVQTARWARAFVREEIDAPVYRSAGNFVLVEVGDAADVAQMLQDRGVIVRDCTSFGLPGHVRVSCGTEHETHEAVRVINDVLSEVQR